MPIRSSKNQYRGINAHLNSYIQNVSGEWLSFHNAYIVNLTYAIDEKLPQGYFARNERSLQIIEDSPLFDEPRTRRPLPDVTVFAAQETASPSATVEASLPSVITPVAETLDPDDEDSFLPAVVIYASEGDNLLGKVVARIELLSPANKPKGNGYPLYRDKRNSTLYGGIPLIEIDFLHQLPPLIRALPSYPDGEANAKAYSITVNDPRPDVRHGVSRIYTFGVDEPLPIVALPLKGEDVLNFDFNVPYNQTFERTRFYQTVVDYEQKPLNFESYSPEDQARIVRRLEAIQKAIKQGQDLEQHVPLPLE